MRSVVLKGAEVKIYIGGQLYPEAQSISYVIDFNKTPIYGIDSIYPQETPVSRVLVKGTVGGIVIKGLGSLQGFGIRSKILQELYSPYVSLRLKDRSSDVDFLWIPKCTISSQNIQIQSKSVARVSFTFIGDIPYTDQDMEY